MIFIIWKVLLILLKKAKQGEFSFPSDIAMITGRFTCRDFSVAGKRKGGVIQKKVIQDKS